MGATGLCWGRSDRAAPFSFPCLCICWKTLMTMFWSGSWDSGHRLPRPVILRCLCSEYFPPSTWRVLHEVACPLAPVLVSRERCCVIKHCNSCWGRRTLCWQCLLDKALFSWKQLILRNQQQLSWGDGQFGWIVSCVIHNSPGFEHGRIDVL